MRYWLMKTEPDTFNVDDLAAAPRATTPQPSLLDAPPPPPRAAAQAVAMNPPTTTSVSAERATVSARPAAESAEPIDLGTGWTRATEEILKKKFNIFQPAAGMVRVYWARFD